MKDRKLFLPLLWIFLTVNYIYCDVFTLTNPEDLKQILSGGGGGIPITQAFLLTFAIVMEIPLAMIILSRILPYAVNRWFNIIAGLIMTTIQLWSLFGYGAAPTLHYIFFSAVEIACNLFIIWYAWTWKNSGEGLQPGEEKL